MASKWPPVKNAAYTFRVYLFAQSDNQIKTSPTLAAGDFQVSIDGGAFANLGTTPSESPASSGQVLVTLAQAEMNGDEMTVRAIDASGDEWHSAAWVIHTVGQTLDTIDGNVDSILTDTAEIGTAGAGLTALATASALATVDGIVDDILEDTGTTLPATLSTLAGYVDTEVAAILAAVDTEVAAILADTNELQTNQGNWTTADVSALATAAAVAALNNLSAAEAQTAAAAALTAYDPPTKAELDSAVSPLATAAALTTVDGIVDAILVDTNELQTNQGNWVTATGFSTLDAAGVRTAVGMASADLDAQLAALPTATENADALLSRDVANVEDTASTDSVAALILAALHSAMSGTDWTIYKTDDATAFVVKAITTDADADPVTGASDPA